jgi:hypothetical protein
MSIEELINRAYTTWAHDKGTGWTDHMRDALTEQAETHALELRAYEATVQNLTSRIGASAELDVNDRSVNALRDDGYAVVVFNPDELEGADPMDVCDRLIELGWDVIEALSYECDSEATSSDKESE